MVAQKTLEDSNTTNYYYIFYREIKSQSPNLSDESFTGEDANKVDTLLDDIFSNTGESRFLQDLDTTRYFRRWIEQSLESSRNICPDEGVSNHIKENLQNVAENFSESMKTRARASGKYVVIILGRDRLTICHSYAGKRALTTDMEVIEKLLSADNIDKYADFRQEEDKIAVSHFDKYDTKSFTNWLGIPSDEIVYDIKGDVKLYSEIADEINATLTLTRDDVVEKLINSDKYKLKEKLFETPNSEENYRINGIRWGNKTYETAEEFKQEALTTYYELTYYKEKYEDLINGDFDMFTYDFIDHEDKLVVHKESERESLIRKKRDDFNILFVNSQISLEYGWRKSLTSQVIDIDKRIPIYHSGIEVADDPVEIGAFRIYNKLGLNEKLLKNTHDFIRTAREIGTSNMQPLILYMAFYLLHKETDSPVCYLFKELAEEYREVYKKNISESYRVTIREGGPASLELKSAEWCYRENDRKIVEGLTDEFKNGAELIIIGVDEQGGKIKGIQKNRFPHERIEGLERKTDQKLEGRSVHVRPIPIDGGDLTITAVTV